LPKDSQVTIKIYDILGREVITLLNGRREAGYHNVIWNGKNKFGRDVASGVYFYKIVAGKFIQTRKMLLLR
jgi:flagellar hook assembly protein FlgD